MKFCCEKILHAINNKLINYEMIDRTYGIVWDNNCRIMILNFCPWCGTTLPEILSDQYLDLLESECGVIFPDEDFSNVPPEFRTDEWWKKRGL